MASAHRTINQSANWEMEIKTVLLNRTAKSIKKWKEKAMLADPHKTRIIIELSKKRTHVPPWVYKDLVELPTENNEQ